MLSKEENEILARVGPGTLCGNLLRCYWHPVGIASEFTPSVTKRRVSILGEHLVLFRKPNGTFGLVGEQCLHRCASLYYGFVEERGLRCAYHGWLFDETGNCLERPFEPKAGHLSKQLVSYPVEELGGLLFAYFGPPNQKPLLPRWDILVRPGRRKVEIQDDLDCNWLQLQENAVDVVHTFFLHSYMFFTHGMQDASGFNRPLRRYGFQPFEWGILKSWEYEGPEGAGWGNLMVFPNILRIMTEMHWRVPIDDLHTRIYWITFTPLAEDVATEPDIEIVRQPKRTGANGEYLLDTFMSQDAMAVETQGQLVDRSRETLGASDIGIAMLRRMLREQIDRVQDGKDPIALVREPSKNTIIDLREWFGGYLPMSCAPDNTFRPERVATSIFDDNHETVEVPVSPILERII